MATIKKDTTQLETKQIHYTVAGMEERFALVDWLAYERTYDLTTDAEQDSTISFSGLSGYSYANGCWQIRGGCAISVPKTGVYYLYITQGAESEYKTVTANGKEYTAIDGVFKIPLYNVSSVEFAVTGFIYVSKITVRRVCNVPATATEDGLMAYADKGKLDIISPAVDLTEAFNDLLTRRYDKPARLAGITETDLEQATHIRITIKKSDTLETGVYDCIKTDNDTLTFDCWDSDLEYLYRLTIAYAIDADGLYFTEYKTDVIAISRNSETAKDVVVRLDNLESDIQTLVGQDSLSGVILTWDEESTSMEWESELDWLLWEGVGPGTLLTNLATGVSDMAKDIKSLQEQVGVDKEALAKKADINHTHTSVEVQNATEANFSQPSDGKLEVFNASLADDITDNPVSGEGFGMLKFPTSKQDAYGRLLISETGKMRVNATTPNLNSDNTWKTVLTEDDASISGNTISINGQLINVASLAHTHKKADISDLPSQYAAVVTSANYVLNEQNSTVLVVASEADIYISAPSTLQTGMMFTILHHGVKSTLHLQFKTSIKGTVKDTVDLSTLGEMITLVYGGDGIWYCNVCK